VRGAAADGARMLVGGVFGAGDNVTLRGGNAVARGARLSAVKETADIIGIALARSKFARAQILDAGKENGMSELHVGERFSAWWQGESRREFTKLEFALLGALFGSIGMNFILIMLYFFY
jgi:hypothetical protein